MRRKPEPSGPLHAEWHFLCPLCCRSALAMATTVCPPPQTQYEAVVALDSDLLILSNADVLLDKVLATPSSSQRPVWFAAHDETPLCERCDAEVGPWH